MWRRCAQAVEARLSEIDAMLQAFGEDEAYDADALPTRASM